jgi:hypothetical protein
MKIAELIIVFGLEFSSKNIGLFLVGFPSNK